MRENKPNAWVAGAITIAIIAVIVGALHSCNMRGERFDKQSDELMEKYLDPTKDPPR